MSVLGPPIQDLGRESQVVVEGVAEKMGVEVEEVRRLGRWPEGTYYQTDPW